MNITVTPLPTTVEEAYKYASKNGRIVPWAEYGQHIPLLCRNHPHLRWSTKNIGGIGSRSIFFDLMCQCNGEIECNCKGNLLEPVVPEDWQSKVIPLRILVCLYCDIDVMEETHFTSGNVICQQCSAIAGPFGQKIEDEVLAIATERGSPFKKGHIAFAKVEDIIKEVVKAKRNI